MLDVAQPLATLALEHPECEETLRSLGLDYACGGSTPLAAACSARGLPPGKVIAALEAAATLGPDPMLLDARSLSTPELLAELTERHHGYAKSALPFAAELAAKVAEVHGHRHLIELAAGVALLACQVMAQLEREETQLFPLLSTGTASPAVRELLAASRREHEQVVQLLGRIRPVAEQFAPPVDACRSQRSLYAELAALEQDLVRHAHLELNVLHPRFGA